jgi:Holliday junction resolvase
MKKSTEILEKKRLNSVAREYRKQGCKVLLYPGETDLPSFLSGFQPDLIAYSDEENVVVEVKSKSTLSKADYLP